MRKHLFTVLLLLCFLPFAGAQNWEVDLLKKANPEQPDSRFWSAVKRSAKPVSVGLPAILLAASYVENDRTLRSKALETFGTLVVNTVSTQAIKLAVNRKRPYQMYTGIYPDELVDGRSFVSGHSALAFGTATTLALQYKKWYITAPAFVWSGAVGYSRLYAGQHYPTDVLGAAVVGFGSALISHKANHWLSRNKKERPVRSAVP